MVAPTGTSAPVRIAYLVAEDWYFLSHRLPMALAAQSAGYEVHVLTHVSDKEKVIAAHGFQIHPLPWRRGSANPLDVFAVVRAVRRAYRRIAPALVHQVALQSVVIGSLASLGLGFRSINALAGLGFIFTSRVRMARMARPVVAPFLRWLLNRPLAMALVQNGDDRSTLLQLGVSQDHIALIPGSGVDTDRIRPLPEPVGRMTMAFVGRLLDDKGIRTLLAAHDLLTRDRPIHLLIAGSPDPANPTSISKTEIESWSELPDVSVLGHVDDIGKVWANAHIAVLPSRREGLPLSLLEAAAYGRPLVATDVPGCREIAREGENAILVQPDDPQALADAIARLANDSDLRRRFAAAGRALVEREFSSTRIGQEIVSLYGRLLTRNGAALSHVQQS